MTPLVRNKLFLSENYTTHHDTLQVTPFTASPFSSSHVQAKLETVLHRVDTQVSPQLSTEKTPRPPKPPPSLDKTINHKNDHVTLHIERSLVQVKEYKVNEKTNQLMHQHQFDAPRNKGVGMMTLIIEGLAEQAHESIKVALDSLGPECRDTFVAITGIFIEKHGTSDMRRACAISIDEILDACGKQRSNGAFTPEARAEVIKHLKTLSQARIKFTMPTTQRVKRGRKWVWEDTEIKVEGPLLTHDGKIGEYTRITGKELWEKQSIVLGPWAWFAGGAAIKTKLVPQQVLAYSSKNEPFHKRLGHYLHGLFRNNAQRTKGIMPHGITMRALFEGALIEPPRERGKFKDDIDNALEHLKQDGVIGNYWYMAEKNSLADQAIVANRTGRWFDTYLVLYINFAPSEATLNNYKNIAKREKEDASIDDEDI
jgi:hypothetical protein